MSDDDLKQLLEAQRRLEEARVANTAFWYGALWNVRDGEGVTAADEILPQSREERELVARRYGIKHKYNWRYR